MTKQIQNREVIIEALRSELFGPSPAGEEIDLTIQNEFEKNEASFGPWRQLGSGEEIITRDDPLKRYGIGVLHPVGSINEESTDEAGIDGLGLIVQAVDEENKVSSGVNREEQGKALEKSHEKVAKVQTETNPNDLDLSLANAYQQSSIGVSFLVELSTDSTMTIKVTGGRYYETKVTVAGKERTWWRREPILVEAEQDCSLLLSITNKLMRPRELQRNNCDGLNPRIEVYSRSFRDNPAQRLVTVCFVNRSETGKNNERCIFQAGLEVSAVSPDRKACILPYPGPRFENLDDEELSIALLYRRTPTFAVGHGCSANWSGETGVQRVEKVIAECIPVFETPSMTPEIKDEEGNKLEIPMGPLAGLVPGNDGFQMLEKVIVLYETWIEDREKEIPYLDQNLRDIARKHMAGAKKCAQRMWEGLKYLQENPQAYKAFQFMNHAILLQQVRSWRDIRSVGTDEKTKKIVFNEPYQEIDPINTSVDKGKWRPFQIAFLLMSIRSTVEYQASDRDTVELIWFPTGGGKTEAYLGLAAFASFYRRLEDNENTGVHVLMRYTLRLLTAQQFQRASRLVCAMENLRDNNRTELGQTPFSIGLWVGGGNTPNTRKEATSILKGLNKGDRSVQNRFILDSCPWCSAQMGPVEYKSTKKKSNKSVVGYLQEGETVVYKCPDIDCPFSEGLPIYVIDEDIYAQRPSLIIGTVDKFAMLAWKAEARSLFGIDRNGERFCSPPGLIIQDELHLISGPLGSLVGLYEALIEELCTDRRKQLNTRPKIVSSTATIRRYAEQIKALYARDNAILFPPPGLDSGDSFFGRYERNKAGSLAPGRKYIGVHAPGLGSMQTVQVRTFTSLLQAPLMLEEEERDPWWTLVLFFNSLRELGTTLSLLQSDIPDYQQVYVNRLPKDKKKWRGFWEIRELTGRASGEEVPKAISALEVKYPNEKQRPIDVCLASNILEVGVDIDRLSLMAVVGQPKTTSQYIQVTGRVGRSWWERPGLIVALYSASKPRDRSHYEKFRSYHEKLYAQVEPTSVTPFSPPALDRALHAVMVAYIMQNGDEDIVKSPYPFPADMIEQLRQILLPRVKIIDEQEMENFKKVFDKRAEQWRGWGHTLWRAKVGEEDTGLLKVAGSYASTEESQLSWPTQQSMRSVDAECIVEIANPTLVIGDLEDA